MLRSIKISSLGALIGILLCATAAVAADKRTPPPELSGLAGPEAEAFYLGANAIIWGYPAVMFEQLMRGRTSPDIVAKGNPQAAVNQFGLVRDLRGPEFKQIATPNNDTIYAQSFVDVSREPIVLSVPAVAAPRYYTFQLWDPNGDTFSYIGSRTTGREAGHFAFVGPNWQGDLPESVTRIDTPYNGLVIWGRIGVDGPEDLQNALDIQDALRLTPLSLFGTSEAQLPPDLAFSEARVAFDASGIPEDLILYAELANSLRHTSPKAQDAVVAATLPQIGFSADGTVFDPSTLTDAQRSGLAKGAQFALHLMDVSSQTAGVGVNGWRWSPKSGIMGNDYLFRAAFAKWYTGGNAPSEAIYMDARTDNTGAALDGSKRYIVRFEKGEEPKVDAFWSISMYHIADGSFVDNPIKRYSIGDRTKGLTRAADGSLTIYIQHDQPEGTEAQANWLPSPADGYYLNLRLYGPDDGLPSGKWAPPPVMIVE
ncbi:MAG: DUF1254 domain-containing protein [Aestuariivirga sp.]|nr:DUF1254 domain-containing protein [Aestuariivirga sp.]